ncbi:MAG: DEAD/DEAH box helicase [Rhodocyclaceae bacterium]|nr:DEAD/DEAH box helicase [Rhodocyclaceae bacterium]
MSFSTRTELMRHQPPAVAKLLPSRVGGLFMDMGTGKSRTLLELARIRQEKFDRLFWFCPCSGRDTIAHEVTKHTTLTGADICIFDDATSERTVPRDRRIYVIGTESMSASDRVVLAYNSLVTEQSFVAVDESQYIKGPRAKRTQRITHMSERARYRAVLTGTPFSQGAVDLYAQMRFLSQKILGYKSFWSFAANHLEYEERKDAYGRKRRTGRILRSHNEDYLAAKIAPYTYQVRKDECLDLPEKLYEDRYCRMTGEQRAYYEQAKDEILLSCDYDDWNPVRLFHLFSTLQTIVCGFWNRTDPATGQTKLIEIAHNRLALLLDTIAEIPESEPVIIWAKFHHAVRQIREALAEIYGAEQVAEFHGKMGDSKRASALARWRAGARFLVATQDTGGQVHTFNEAAYALFYADSFKYDKRRQAEDRNHRIGQTRRPVYGTLRCLDSIDARIAQAIERKGNALEAFQDRLDVYRRQGMKKQAIELVRAL